MPVYFKEFFETLSALSKKKEIRYVVLGILLGLCLVALEEIQPVRTRAHASKRRHARHETAPIQYSGLHGNSIPQSACPAQMKRELPNLTGRR